MNWKAPEFTFFAKSTVWYTTSIVVALLLILFSFLRGNILFGIFVIVAEILVLYWARQEPSLLEYSFTDTGLSAGEKFYPMNSLSAFSFVADHPDDPYFELVFEPIKVSAKYIKILVPVDIVDGLFAYIEDYLEEFDYDEGISEHLMKKLRF
jgi:hypothetical protein